MHADAIGKLREIDAREREMPTAQTLSPAKYERLIARAKATKPATAVVLHPCEETCPKGQYLLPG